MSDIKSYYENFVKIVIKDEAHFQTFINKKNHGNFSEEDLKQMEALWKADKLTEAMNMVENMPIVSYKTDITMEDILEKDVFTKPIPKRLKNTKLPKKIKGK